MPDTRIQALPKTGGEYQTAPKREVGDGRDHYGEPIEIGKNVDGHRSSLNGPESGWGVHEIQADYLSPAQGSLSHDGVRRT